MSGPPYWTPTPTPVITPIPQTTYSYLINNITSNKFDIVQLPASAMAPYGFVVTGILAIPFFIIFMAYFYSMWISHGNLRMASIIGLMFGAMVLLSTGGLGVGMPAPILPLAYGALCASIAGFIMSIFKNA
jgi:hypothetical protein